jgi:nucleotide-binding universal stress UspA family protein
MLKRILVALSGTPFTPVAVRQAVQLARQHGASITGVTVVDIERLSDVGPVPLGGGSAAHELTEHRVSVTQDRVEKEIAEFERAYRHASIPYVVDRERGDAFELLLAPWRYHDLIVIGLSGLFEYGVVHNPDDLIIQLVYRGAGPILAVTSEYHEVNRVLVAYSGSRQSAMDVPRSRPAPYPSGHAIHLPGKHGGQGLAPVSGMHELRHARLAALGARRGGC